ncbi:hypothetical protein J19TS2_07970 [Cohnella xylanilytica]|uniref:Flp pilus assembly protein TadB n=1 Tax=Cohnella xylanilytica TaxID=557555 RepID=A0A841UA76_9BACL|nr:hypothetical protein [Cohnella xylanilytica]MBB6694830.1 hypothetical protein [Cohnella xylanilytica]GIO11242.1 hypothetical protein J19TS2_07970 [Cohnella xylanilytica]
MRPSWSVALLLIALFVFCFAAVHSSLALGWTRADRRRRLRTSREPAWNRAAARLLSRLGKPYAHVADLLAAAGWTMTPEAFAVLSLALGVSGAASGIALFQSARSVLLLTLMLALLPYCFLRFRLINRQMAARLDFLPALELFYQCYLITGRRHVRTALQKTVEERRLPGEIQSIFEQLYRNLCVKGDDEGDLRRFALAVGHVWAEYFANMLGIALSEGNDISDNLKELIGDMRKSRMDDQAERHRLLEIRLANFSPVLFLALFLGINFRMNSETSYRYYVLDPAGRGMLLNALVLMFASFLMGIYLSRRKL